MVRGLCPAGVEEHSKCEKGFYGNLGEPPTSNREVVKKKKKGLTTPKKVQARQVSIATCQSVKKRQYRQWYPKQRETECKETGEGSLSIPIIPLESW